MASGHRLDNDGRLWTLTLRDGLRFYDNTLVLARDVVANLARWGRRDSFGLALIAATDEIDILDDRTIRFRLRRPFPLLPDALAKTGANIAAIMSERLARTDAFAQVTEMVGGWRHYATPGSQHPTSPPSRRSAATCRRLRSRPCPTSPLACSFNRRPIAARCPACRAGSRSSITSNVADQAAPSATRTYGSTSSAPSQTIFTATYSTINSPTQAIQR